MPGGRGVVATTLTFPIADMAYYHCVTSSIDGFVHRLALDYVQYGFFFYVAGSVPEGMDPKVIERDIISLYKINVSRWTRFRRAKRGLGSVHYLRFERFYVIIANQGEHLFRERERQRIKDIREVPVHFAGYSIGYKRAKGGQSWHPSVRIERNQYRVLKTEFLRTVTHLSVKQIIRAFRSLPFEPFAPVRWQNVDLLHMVNDKRKTASLPLVPVRALRFLRRPVKRFDNSPRPGPKPPGKRS
jgi:hypothetical protein